MRALIVGTAGHIDHGKSALVCALTGTDPDRLKEEKERGITIDLGFAHLDLGQGRVASFIDVPGHERFVRNMLAGAHGIDAALLVVAADEGVKPQTREHFQICRLLGLARGLIVLTKCDLAAPEQQDRVQAQAGELVAGSFLEDAPVLRVSARTGAGLDALRRRLLALAGWHTQPEGLFIARARHVQALRRTQSHLAQAEELLVSPAPALELLAEELRLSHDSLGEITGQFSADDLLGEIFSHFCIGK